MLLVTRKYGESIVLTLPSGERIKVISFNGGRSRIGIDAPKHVRIMREEIDDAEGFERERLEGMD